MVYLLRIVRLVLILCLLCACNSTRKRLLRDTLYVVESTENGEKLLGVTDITTGDTLIAPKQYETITADTHCITCKTADGMTDAYKLDGTFIGHFDLFTHWTDRGTEGYPATNYYIGTAYNRTCHYYPDSDSVVWEVSPSN